MKYSEVIAQKAKNFNDCYGNIGQRIIDVVNGGANSVEICIMIQEFIKESITEVPLKRGNTYQTRNGDDVYIIGKSDQIGCETVLGSDGICRYNREHDIGRVPGTFGDWPDANNIPTQYTTKIGLL